MNFEISPKRIARILILISLGLAIASLTGQFYIYFFGYEKLLGLVNFFNVDSENNLPTLYSALLLLLSSVLLSLIALTKQENSNRYTLHWQGLSIIFLYLSFDEWLQIHEKFNSRLNTLIESASNKNWDVLNLIFISVFVLIYLNFFFKLPAKIKRLFVVACTLFVIGAFVIEVIGVHYFPNIYHQRIFLAEVISTIEEGLEMIGITIFIYALLTYMSTFMKHIHINIVDNDKKTVTNQSTF